MHLRRDPFRYIFVLPVIATGSLIAFLSALDMLSNELSFAMLNCLLLAYLILEIRVLKRAAPDRWLINPIVFSSIVTFMLHFGLTNVLYAFPDSELLSVGILPGITSGMVKLMWLVMIGAIAMWLGYWSPVAGALSSPQIMRRFQASFLPETNSLRSFSLPLVAAIGIGAKLIQIKLGVFGYASSYERLTEMASITQYLTLAGGLSKLALVLAALQYYSSGRARRAALWFWALIAIEIAFGFLSGFKSAVAIPFVIAGICYYLINGVIPKKLVVITFLFIIAAYGVVEPYRALRNYDAGSIDTSIGGIATRIIDSTAANSIGVDDQTPFFIALLARSNLTHVGYQGIEFADDNPTLPPDSPEFLKNIFLAPLYAWIPRLVWEGKPLSELGLWYTQIVIGNDFISSTAMGPFTYLYLAGGFVAVFFGFFFIGILQRSLFTLLQPSRFQAGAVIFLSQLATIAIIDSAIDGLVASIFRELPLVILLQFILFKAKSRQYIMAEGQISRAK